MSAPGMVRRYYIKVQQRSEYNGRFPRYNWRAYRKWSVWPILFVTSEEAHDFMRDCFTFKGLHGRKMSAAVHCVYVNAKEQLI